MRCSKKNHHSQIFVEIFSGKGGMARKAERCGFGAVAIDIRDNPLLDACDPLLVARLEGWLSSRSVMGLWLGTPCSSWSRVRHDLPDGGGPRSSAFLMGKPGLTPADARRVDLGNRTLGVSIRLIKRAIALRIPTVLENPSTSMMWMVPKLEKVVSKGESSIIDYCQFGKPWRKRTRFASWNLGLDLLPEGRCVGKGICSRTGLPHRRLQGTDPVTGLPWTQVAEPYPAPLVRAWWSAFENSAARLSLQARAALLGC
jgi:hypothetical protein